MCLFFIFGVAPKDRRIGREMKFCSYCGREAMHSIVERRMWFFLFFIPLFPVSSKQVIAICEECSLSDTSHTGTFASARPPRQGTKVCPSCGEEIPERANYCPNCGYPVQ